MTQSKTYRPQDRPDPNDKDHGADPAVLASILARSRDCIQILDQHGYLLFANETGLKLAGVQTGAAPWSALWPKGKEEGEAALLAAQAGGTGRFEASRPLDGSERFWDVEVSPVGTGDRLLVIGRDATEKRELQRALQAAAAEQNHSIKNQMAVVQSIVNQSLRGAYPPDMAKKMIAARLDVLARAHDLLMHSSTKRVALGDLVAAGTQMLDGRRMSLAGPELPIGPKAALSLALILHELAINAAAHGAHSVPDGRVQISWGPAEMDGEPGLEIHFVESGGPAVSPPASKGFGTRLVQGGLSGSPSRASLAFHPEGVRFRLVALLASVQSQD
jgi:two-component sensor histidine kinase